jgi:hypothetical protein
MVDVGTNTTMVSMYDLLRTDVAFIDNENGHCDYMEANKYSVVNQCLGMTMFYLVSAEKYFLLKLRTNAMIIRTNISLTDNFIMNLMNCTPPWTNGLLKKCDTVEQYKTFLKLNEDLMNFSEEEFFKQTSCMPSCNR